MSSRKPTNPIDPELAAIYRREQSATSRKPGGHGGAIALTIVVILAVVLTALFSRKPEASQKSPERDDTGLNAVSCENTQKLSEGDMLFWRWIHLLDPTQWYYPTKEGFSRYNDFEHFNSRNNFNSMKCLEHPALQGFQLPQNPLPPPKPTVTTLSAQLPPMNVSAFMGLDLYTAEQSSNSAKVPEVIEARWRRLGGGVLVEGPKFTGEEKRLLQDKATQEILANNLSKNPFPDKDITTRLEVQFLPGVLQPRVLIRESCGNHEVDLAALHALQRMLSERLIGGRPFNSLASVFLEVDWLM